MVLDGASKGRIGTSRSSLDLWRADGDMNDWTRLPNNQLRIECDSMDDFIERLVVA